MESPSYEAYKEPLLNVKETDSERLSSLPKVPSHLGFHSQVCLTVKPFPLPQTAFLVRRDTTLLGERTNMRLSGGPAVSWQLVTFISWSLPKEFAPPFQEQGDMLLAALSTKASLQAGGIVPTL